jgi:hypothetical protein
VLTLIPWASKPLETNAFSCRTVLLVGQLTGWLQRGEPALLDAVTIGR